MPPSEHEREKIERLRRAMYSRGLSDQLKERPRHHLDGEDDVVGEDWKNPEEKLAGMTVAPRFVGATRTVLMSLLAGAVIFFVAAVGFFIYFFVFGSGASPASPSNIDIVVTGPPDIAGGDPAELQVSITNKNKIPLELADLVVTYPPGTRSPSDFSTDLPSTRISLGTIEPGGNRQGKIGAVFSGSSNAHADVKVQLEYHVAGSNSIFVASSVYTLNFRSSPISIALDGNTETVAGQPLRFTVNVASNANAPQKDVLLHLDYPFGFTFKSATPAPDAAGTWYLGDFAPGEKKSVDITGTMNGEPNDTRVFHMSAGTRDNAASSTITNKLADDVYPVKISGAFLGLSIQVNTGDQKTATTTFSKAGSPTPVASPGSTVSVTIRYVNNLPAEIDDAIIVAKISGTQIDGSNVRSSDGVYRSSDGVILWDKTTTEDKLSQIAPGESGTVTFTFQVPDAAGQGVNPHVDISVNAAGKRPDEQGVPQSLQSAVSQKIGIATNLQLKAEGLYFANPFGSTGPLPPQPEVETTYALVFSVTNTTNKITNTRMTARLPPYVRWTGIYSPSTENIYVDGKIYQSGRVLTPPPGDPCQGTSGICWSIGTVNPGTGINTDPRQAAISIGFTPSSSQIGQSPVLLQNIVLTGTDATTGETVTINSTSQKSPVKDVTTNIVGDPGFTPAQSIVTKPPVVQ